MKVKEMRDLIDQLSKEGKLTTQNVEFVVDAKKYFPEDLKAGTDTLSVSLTRNHYHPLPVTKLSEALKIAQGDIEIKVTSGPKTLGISETFITDSALEVVLK